MNFCEIFKNTLLRNTFWRILLFDGQIFHQLNSKKTAEKRKLEIAGKKQQNTQKRKLKHFLLQVFMSFYNSKIEELRKAVREAVSI